MMPRCPICGAVGTACHEAPYLDPVEIPPMEFKEVVSMPPIAKEQKGKWRVPQQRVAPGRGKAGYKGGGDIVEVYAVPSGRASYETPKAAAEDLESMTRAELDDIATGLGLDPTEYGNKGKIIDAIREARDE